MNATLLNLTTVLQVNSTLIEGEIRRQMQNVYGGTLVILTVMLTGLMFLEGLRRSGKITEERYCLFTNIIFFTSLLVGFSRLGFLFLGL